VILFADDLPEFLKGFDESLRALEKAVKEKRRGAPRGNRPGEGSGERRRAAAETATGKKRYTGGAKPGAGSSAKPGSGSSARPGRKVVVKKRKDT
jgi:hypothetical protein